MTCGCSILSCQGTPDCNNPQYSQCIRCCVTNALNQLLNLWTSSSTSGLLYTLLNSACANKLTPSNLLVIKTQFINSFRNEFVSIMNTTELPGQLTGGCNLYIFPANFNPGSQIGTYCNTFAAAIATFENLTNPTLQDITTFQTALTTFKTEGQFS